MKADALKKYPGAFAKFSERGNGWLILWPRGTGSFIHVGQGATARAAWSDAS